MPTIEINTTTQPSGLSYEWDLLWDIKTPEEACQTYLRLKDKLASQLARMEALARQDNIELPTADYGEQVQQKALAILTANPGKLIRLLPDEDDFNFWGMPFVMSHLFFQKDFEGTEVNTTTPDVLVDIDGAPWADSGSSVLHALVKLLDAGQYTVKTIEEYEADLTE